MLRSADELRCTDVLDHLEAWIDGDLDDGLSDGIRRHLAGCPSCRTEEHLANEVHRSLQDLPEFEAPQPVIDAVLSEVHPPFAEISVRNWLSRMTARPLRVMAAAAAVVLLVVVVIPDREPAVVRPSDQEVERVTAQTRLALAYLGSAVRRGEKRVKARIVEDKAVTATVDGISKSLSWTRGASVVPTPQQLDEGSL